MPEVAERLDRTCSDCGDDLDIIIFKDGSYAGGHYWDLDFDEHGELWECHDCFTDGLEDDEQ